ncbi:MAG: glycine cleavage system protein R [Actinomycetota bacterium]
MAATEGARRLEDRLLSITVIGVDRPGIVAAVARVLYDLGCNLEDVTSTILRGNFSMVLVLRAPETVDAAYLEVHLQAVARELDLVVAARTLQEGAGPPAPPTHLVSVYGSDKPGIVYRITEALASVGANITDLTSRVVGEDGEPVYALMLEVALADPDALQEHLDRLGRDLDVEVTIHPLETEIL